MPEIKKEKVIEVHHCTDKLFTFKTTRDAGLRFNNGEFVMVGLEVDGKKIMRAYSIASANYEDFLNFISIKVPDGELTSRLQHMQVGDEVLISQKPVGTLTIDRLTEADNLYLLATGTGLAPFMSIIADPETYEKFKTVYVVHCTRNKEELIYSDYITNLHKDELMGEFVTHSNLKYIPTTTQEPNSHGRITNLIYNGDLLLQKNKDRVMICGNPNMLAELTEYFEANDWLMGSIDEPGDFTIEKAFVDR